MAARMMFDFLGEKTTGSLIEKAIIDVLVEGKVRTYDLGGTSSSTRVAEVISEKLRKSLCQQ
jgi:isocitrate/isopropylmalate dehydrogenase